MTKNQFTRHSKVQTFFVPLEKSYAKERGHGHLTIRGYLPLEAKDQDAARAIIEQLLNRWQGDCLQTSDPKIVWEEDPPGDGWEYVDFSFDLPEREFDSPSDWSRKPGCTK